MLWWEYLQMVKILLMFTRAQRDGIWELHLLAFKRMLPYFHRYDHTNYASWGSVYLAEINQLPHDILETFYRDNFVIQIGNTTFNQVDPDQAQAQQSINVRNMLKRKFDKCKDYENWERYRRQRNIVIKLRKKSLSLYLKKKCNLTHDGKDFWKTVKPLISDKTKGSDEITLLENDSIVNDKMLVADILNNYYVNVTRDIGVADDITESDTLI